MPHKMPHKMIHNGAQNVSLIRPHIMAHITPFAKGELVEYHNFAFNGIIIYDIAKYWLQIF
jgi:hypothetical protein